jgi:hypothetical protein
MGRAKDIILKVIPSNIANDFVRAHHYSGKVVNNSTLHFGCFLDGVLHGVMSYGNSMDKSKVSKTVRNTGWNEFIELNRMAFDDILPKNSESRCIAISIKLLKKNAPHIKWIISYSDASQCGDGSIYRASGFDLIGIKVNKEILQLQNGKRINVITLNTNKNLPKINGKYFSRHLKETGQAKPVEGFQLKYIYFLDPAKRADLAHPIIPFSKIDEMGAGMYRGEKITLAERKIIRDDSINGNAPDSQSGEDVRGDLVAQTPNP